MTETVRVEGRAELARALRQMTGDLSDLKDANAAVADLVAQAASSRAPRRSGALAASVRGNRAAGRATVTVGGARIPYAGPIHYGWPARGIEPRPFVDDAASATEAAWTALYEQAVDRIVDAVNA